jgi:hypothetical protein
MMRKNVLYILVTKATDTDSLYVTITAFPQKKMITLTLLIVTSWVRYIACLVLVVLFR